MVSTVRLGGTAALCAVLGAAALLAVFAWPLAASASPDRRITAAATTQAAAAKRLASCRRTLALRRVSRRVRQSCARVLAQEARRRQRRRRPPRRSPGGSARTPVASTPAPAPAPPPAPAPDPPSAAASAPAPAPAPAPGPAPAPAPAPTPSSTPPTWSDDFESSNWSAWQNLNGNTSTQALASRYFSRVGDPAGGGGRVFKATVDGEAVAAGEAGQRALLTQYPSSVPSNNRSGAFEGSEQWYRARIYFPHDFVPARNSDWNWVLEWHNWPDGPCCANLAVTVDTDPTRGSGERLVLRSMGGGAPDHPVDVEDPYPHRNPTTHDDHIVGDAQLDRGHWYEVLMHVKWSYRSDQGLVEWWLDGRQVVSRQTSTLYWYTDGNSGLSGAQPGPGQAYIQAGYYRDNRLRNGATDTSVMSVYHDDYRRGPTRNSVD
jgi:Polysaccharide lyase